MKKSQTVEELKKENEELKKRIEELELMLSQSEREDAENDEEDIVEIENPYTVTNRAITELVEPRDTMFYLSSKEISLILTAYMFSILPQYFGEEPVLELAQFANMLKKHLVSKGGRGRRDILRVLRASAGQVRENVNKSLFRQLLKGGEEHEDEYETE